MFQAATSAFGSRETQALKFKWSETAIQFTAAIINNKLRTFHPHPYPLQ